jgi:hypothetical protein
MRGSQSSSIQSISAKYSVLPPHGLRKYQYRFDPRMCRPGVVSGCQPWAFMQAPPIMISSKLRTSKAA